MTKEEDEPQYLMPVESGPRYIMGRSVGSTMELAERKEHFSHLIGLIGWIKTDLIDGITNMMAPPYDLKTQVSRASCACSSLSMSLERIG